MGEYLPVVPVNDEAKKHNGSLPGMGGAFNPVNLAVYHYGGNNPVKYVDPNGKEPVESFRLFNLVYKIMKNIKEGDWSNEYTFGHWQKAKLDKETLLFVVSIGKPNACSGGATAFRNFWKNRDITPFLYPEDLAVSNEIIYYRDSAGNIITDHRELAAKLKSGDVVLFQGVDQETGLPDGGTGHSYTVLYNDKKNEMIYYIEYHVWHEDTTNETYVEVRRASYDELQYYGDEGLIGGATWKD
ncbi:MAG: hypothetical protein JXB49_06285 [Bacteroidales bacterium]|nr:hypothetical protein [Bacteroidales bacterium]